MIDGTDYRQFKYRGINKRLLESLVNSQLYFARPDTLNDPFDCRIDLQAAFERAYERASGGHLQWLRSVIEDGKSFQELERTFSGLGVCSLSMSQDNTLMWSHYGDEHRGVCLTYQFTKEFLLKPAIGLAGIARVTYDDNAFTSWLAIDQGIVGREYLQELGKIYLTTKSPAWRYEDEVRIVLNSQGLLDIPKSSLLQVCFGLRTPQEDIDLVVKLATEHAGCKRFARMIRDQRSDFGLAVVEL